MVGLGCQFVRVQMWELSAPHPQFCHWRGASIDDMGGRRTILTLLSVSLRPPFSSRHCLSLTPPPPPPSVAVSAVSRASDRSILQVVYKAFDQEGKGRLPYAQVGGWVGTARQGLFMMMHGLGCVGGRCRAGFVCVCMYAWTHT